MKLPTFMFPILNVAMRWLLASRFHAVVSSSIMLVTFSGRRSGIQYKIPVRFIEDSETVRAFTSEAFMWWRNMREPTPVTLLMKGTSAEYTMSAIVREADQIRPYLLELLRQYPQDAAYYKVGMEKNGHPVSSDLEQALTRTVMLEAARVR